MYASNSALLNALAQQKIRFKQVLSFIEARYDFSPTAFENGAQKNAANENQGSCKVFSFAQLNHFNQLDTLALFAEHYHAVRDSPEGTDHQNIRQFIHHGWAGIQFDGQALTPKSNIDEINQKVAQTYAAGGSEFAELQNVENPQPTENQPGAVPTPNPVSDELVENTKNFTEPSGVKDADGSVDEKAQAAPEASVAAAPTQTDAVAETSPVADTEPVLAPANAEQPEPIAEQPAIDDAHENFDEKAEQAIAEAQAVNNNETIIAPAPGSSNTMNSESTYHCDNDSVTEGTATHDVDSEVSTTDTTSSVSSTSASTTAQTHGASDLGTSASELVADNANHIADNPAAFIEQDNSTTPANEEEASDSAATINTTKASTADTANTANTANASTLGTASASEIAHSNAVHVADNPAAFIEEKNTDTDSNEPATGTDDHTHTEPKAIHTDTNKEMVDGHGSASTTADSTTSTTRDGEVNEQVTSSEKPQNQ